MGRPLGVPNKDKPFREALRLELAAAGEDLKRLRVVAGALLSKAEEGDVSAIREIADRLDGKVPQAHTGPDDGPIELRISRIERAIVDPANPDRPGIPSAAGAEPV